MFNLGVGFDFSCEDDLQNMTFAVENDFEILNSNLSVISIKSSIH